MPSSLCIIPGEEPYWQWVQDTTTLYCAKFDGFKKLPPPPSRLRKLGPWREGFGYWRGRNGVRLTPAFTFQSNTHTYALQRFRFIKQHHDWDGARYKLEVDAYCLPQDEWLAKEIFAGYCYRWPIDDNIEGNGEWQIQAVNTSHDRITLAGKRFTETITLAGPIRHNELIQYRKHQTKRGVESWVEKLEGFLKAGSTHETRMATSSPC